MKLCLAVIDVMFPVHSQRPTVVLGVAVVTVVGDDFCHGLVQRLKLRLSFLVAAVCVTLRLPVMCLGDLTLTRTQ